MYFCTYYRNHNIITPPPIPFVISPLIRIAVSFDTDSCDGCRSIGVVSARLKHIRQSQRRHVYCILAYFLAPTNLTRRTSFCIIDRSTTPSYRAGIFRRFRRVFELNDEESTDVELSSLSEFRSKLINGTGRAVLVEDTRACNDKRVLKFVSDPHLRQFYHTLTTLQRHPHLCHVHEVIAVDEDSVAIVQQFASHGSLREVLSYLPSHALSEENARLLFQQLVLAVDYLVKEVGEVDMHLCGGNTSAHTNADHILTSLSGCECICHYPRHLLSPS